MARRGRKRKPAEVHRRNGNPGKRPLPAAANVVQIVPVGDDTPTQLGPAGREMWDLARKHGTRWLAESDRAALQLLCEKFDRREDMVQRLAADPIGPVLQTDKGYRYPNPLVGMLSTIERELVSLLAQLGFDPTARAALGVAEVKAVSGIHTLLERRAKSGPAAT